MEQEVRHCLIEDVVIPLGVCELYNSGAFQQIGSDSSPADAPSLVELDLHKLSKAGGIVIPHCLGIAKCLKQGI